MDFAIKDIFSCCWKKVYYGFHTINRKYTKARRPWNLAYSEIYLTLSEARKREFHLKSLKSRIAIEKLIKAGPVV